MKINYENYLKDLFDAQRKEYETTVEEAIKVHDEIMSLTPETHLEGTTIKFRTLDGEPEIEVSQGNTVITCTPSSVHYADMSEDAYSRGYANIVDASKTIQFINKAEKTALITFEGMSRINEPVFYSLTQEKEKWILNVSYGGTHRVTGPVNLAWDIETEQPFRVEFALNGESATLWDLYGKIPIPFQQKLLLKCWLPYT